MWETGEMGRAHQTVNRHLLPLPMGEVAERSKDGEGRRGCSTLSYYFLIKIFNFNQEGIA